MLAVSSVREVLDLDSIWITKGAKAEPELNIVS